MRIAIYQMNSFVGNCFENASKIISASEEAKEKGADLMVCPELAITGYPPQDLLLDQDFLKYQENEVLRVVKNISVPTIFGCVRIEGNHIYNSAIYAKPNQENQIIYIDKTLLPNYDVFDEKRYFKPAISNKPINIDGQIVGITICEDMWSDEKDVNINVVDSLIGQGATMIVNISASPFYAFKSSERLNVIEKHLQKLSGHFIYCNAVGNSDELIFDGTSIVSHVDNNPQSEDYLCYDTSICPSFEEGIFYYDTDLSSFINIHSNDLYDHERMKIIGCSSLIELEWIEDIAEGLSLAIRDYCSKSGFQKVVIGISGGIDSAVVAALAVKALGKENVMGVFMPSKYTSQESSDLSFDLCQNLEIKLINEPIDYVLAYDYMFCVKDEIGENGRFCNNITMENIQARERGKILMAISNDTNALVLSTGNKTEYSLGYTTLYGDSCGGIAVIGDLNKNQVYLLAKYFPEIPLAIKIRRPSAELSEEQLDPFDYNRISDLVDMIVDHQPKSEILKAGFSEDEIKIHTNLINQYEFKRKQCPPIFKVAPTSFGIGRRMPIVHGWKL